MYTPCAGHAKQYHKLDQCASHKCIDSILWSLNIFLFKQAPSYTCVQGYTSIITHHHMYSMSCRLITKPIKWPTVRATTANKRNAVLCYLSRARLFDRERSPSPRTHTYITQRPHINTTLICVWCSRFAVRDDNFSAARARSVIAVKSYASVIHIYNNRALDRRRRCEQSHLIRAARFRFIYAKHCACGKSFNSASKL